MYQFSRFRRLMDINEDEFKIGIVTFCELECGI
jgi:hypothetical protein